MAGLRYAGFEYHKSQNIKINPDNDLFVSCGFVDYSNYNMVSYMEL